MKKETDALIEELRKEGFLNSKNSNFELTETLHTIDREENNKCYSAIKNAIQYVKDNRKSSLVSVYGAGAVGKSTIADYLEERLINEKEIVVRINLNSFEYSSLETIDLIDRQDFNIILIDELANYFYHKNKKYFIEYVIASKIFHEKFGETNKINFDSDEETSVFKNICQSLKQNALSSMISGAAGVIGSILSFITDSTLDIKDILVDSFKDAKYQKKFEDIITEISKADKTKSQKILMVIFKRNLNSYLSDNSLFPIIMLDNTETLYDKTTSIEVEEFYENVLDKIENVVWYFSGRKQFLVNDLVNNLNVIQLDEIVGFNEDKIIELSLENGLLFSNEQLSFEMASKLKNISASNLMWVNAYLEYMLDMQLKNKRFLYIDEYYDILNENYEKILKSVILRLTGNEFNIFSDRTKQILVFGCIPNANYDFYLKLFNMLNIKNDDDSWIKTNKLPWFIKRVDNQIYIHSSISDAIKTLVVKHRTNFFRKKYSKENLNDVNEGLSEQFDEKVEDKELRELINSFTNDILNACISIYNRQKNIGNAVIIANYTKDFVDYKLEWITVLRSLNVEAKGKDVCFAIILKILIQDVFSYKLFVDFNKYFNSTPFKTPKQKIDYLVKILESLADSNKFSHPRFSEINTTLFDTYLPVGNPLLIRDDIERLYSVYNKYSNFVKKLIEEGNASYIYNDFYVEIYEYCNKYYDNLSNTFKVLNIMRQGFKNFDVDHKAKELRETYNFAIQNSSIFRDTYRLRKDYINFIANMNEIFEYKSDFFINYYNNLNNIYEEDVYTDLVKNKFNKITPKMVSFLELLMDEYETYKNLGLSDKSTHSLQKCFSIIGTYFYTLIGSYKTINDILNRIGNIMVNNSWNSDIHNYFETEFYKIIFNTKVSNFKAKRFLSSILLKAYSANKLHLKIASFFIKVFDVYPNAYNDIIFDLYSYIIDVYTNFYSKNMGDYKLSNSQIIDRFTAISKILSTKMANDNDPSYELNNKYYSLLLSFWANDSNLNLKNENYDNYYNQLCEVYIAEQSDDIIVNYERNLMPTFYSYNFSKNDISNIKSIKEKLLKLERSYSFEQSYLLRRATNLDLVSILVKSSISISSNDSVIKADVLNIVNSCFFFKNYLDIKKNYINKSAYNSIELPGFNCDVLDFPRIIRLVSKHLKNRFISDISGSFVNEVVNNMISLYIDSCITNFPKEWFLKNKYKSRFISLLIEFYIEMERTHTYSLINNLDNIYSKFCDNDDVANDLMYIFSEYAVNSGLSNKMIEFCKTINPDTLSMPHILHHIMYKLYVDSGDNINAILCLKKAVLSLQNFKYDNYSAFGIKRAIHYYELLNSLIEDKNEKISYFKEQKEILKNRSDEYSFEVLMSIEDYIAEN